MTPAVRVGISVHDSLLSGSPAATRGFLDRVAATGVDHVTLGDHVSFHDGTGFDGLISAAAVLVGHDTLPVHVGVYQLALRHPLLVSRQLSTLAQIAPGRLVLGVGVGGEDRLEISNSGVDPASRGRRTDECLQVLRDLEAGKPVDHAGEFFTLEQAAIGPAPDPAVPIVIGGAGDHAIRRTVAYGDGWLGMFCSARRFAETRSRILEAAEGGTRPAPAWFGLSVWCGFGPDADTARATLSAELKGLYHLPGERFANVTPAGTPAQVADWLRRFVDAGATDLTLVPAAADARAGLDGVAEVRELLRHG